MIPVPSLPEDLRWWNDQTKADDSLSTVAAAHPSVFGAGFRAPNRLDSYSNGHFSLQNYGTEPVPGSRNLFVGFWDTLKDGEEWSSTDRRMAQFFEISPKDSFSKTLGISRRSTSYGYKLRYWFIVIPQSSSYSEMDHLKGELASLIGGSQIPGEEQNTISVLLQEIQDSPDSRSNPAKSIAALGVLLFAISRGTPPGIDLAEAVIDFSN